MNLLISNGIYFGQPAMLVCDGNCRKAWGRNCRPRIANPENEDDYAYLSDDELGEAPICPGTREGADAKPLTPAHNKWCWRECERAELTRPGEAGGENIRMELKDFSRRFFNLEPHYREET